MKICLEIRAGEGGEDAKLLVREQAAIYIKHAQQKQLKLEVLNEDHG